MKLKQVLAQPGVAAVLGAALLFGAGTPAAKWLLGSVSPWWLAGLFYLGSGFGLAAYRGVRRMSAPRLGRTEAGWLAGAIAAGGIVAPLLLMLGLAAMPASSASLLLNAEAALTALLAWFAFKENFDRRIALGMAAIVAGTLVLSWPAHVRLAAAWPTLAVLAACLAWAIDNNLTRKVALADATWIAELKGLVAGAVNTALAAALGGAPAAPDIVVALAVGALAYGASLALFVVGLRHLGTARTAAYFSVAPFFGALLAVAAGEPASARLGIAAGLMALGAWLHLTEKHDHEHAHGEVVHDHEHVHDLHHQHEHDPPVAPGTRHGHPHRHAALVHGHAHFPDSHHRHSH